MPSWHLNFLLRHSGYDSTTTDCYDLDIHRFLCERNFTDTSDEARMLLQQSITEEIQKWLNKFQQDINVSKIVPMGL